MIDTYIYIVEDFLFLFVGLLLLYLFVLAIASHFKCIIYPKAQKEHRCVLLVPEGNTLPAIYKEQPYEFIVYTNLTETIQALDDEEYEFVILLSDTAYELSPQFVEKINNTYDAGVKVIQLHSVTKNRRGFQRKLHAICDEINNTLFRIGNTQLGFSAALFGTNFAVDLKWLKKNQKSIRTNLERKLFRQHIYIEYLPETTVYCESAPVYPYRKRIKKILPYLFPSLLEGNWSFFNRTIQQLTPSPLRLYTFLGILALIMTGYNWTLSIKWWIILFGFAVAYSLAIPDYLVEDTKKKKHFIWRKAH